MHIRIATMDDLDDYVAFASAAQSMLANRSLKQYVPAAHSEYKATIEEYIKADEIYVAEYHCSTAGFFRLTQDPSPWWKQIQVASHYISGVVVSSEFRGKSIGRQIIHWAAERSRESGSLFLRLDCHSENQWLCNYYEGMGFRLIDRVIQHKDYIGCLYQLSLV